MKILSFSYCYPNQSNPSWGIFVQHRLTAMARRAEIRVVSPRPWFPGTDWLRGEQGPAEELRQGMRVYRPRFLCIPKILKSYDGFLYARSLHRWLDRYLAEWRPDLLDAHFIWPDGVGVARLAARVQIPYSITLRGKLHPCLDIPAQRKECAAALLRAEQVISVDPRMAELAAGLGVPASRIQVIPNGVDVNHFRPGSRSDARRNLDLPLDGRLIVSVAHLGQRKGHYETIVALKNLPEDVRLVLVGGSGPGGGDGEKLCRVARAAGVANRLILAGKQPHERIPKYYQAANLTVLASWREGCPNTVLESLACGVPVVATDVGSVSRMIDDGINGRIVPVRSASRLAAGIQSVLDRPPAPEIVRGSPAVHSWNAIADEVLKVFEPIAPRPPASATPVLNSPASGQETVRCS